MVPVSNWRHVPSQENPADLISRGLSASKLIKTALWWQGPKWLLKQPQYWPAPLCVTPKVLPELRLPVTIVAPPPEEDEFWTRYSSFDHMIRIYSWVRRFIYNSKNSRANRQQAPQLTSQECQTTKDFFIRMAQLQSFPEVFEACARDKRLPKSHPLARLSTFVDTNHILKVTGRVRDYRLVRQARTLTPLSLKSGITKLLIQSLHQRYLHPGVTTLLSIIGDMYYIPGLKNFLKLISRQCSTCQRAYARSIQPQMGLLPSVRTTPAPPFANTGMDFAGPFRIRQGHTRRPVLLKAYACVFICLATKAIHIKLCADLSTDEFMAAIRRFCARRGYPTRLHSDNGSNFVGAHNELEELKLLTLKSKQAISHFCSQSDVQWSFIPPRTPHFGGIWEAGVRAMKTLLRKLVSPQPMRFHELTTVLADVEAVLNSRPLAPLDATDAND